MSSIAVMRRQWYDTGHCCSVAHSRLTLWPYGLQHARLFIVSQSLLRLLSIELVILSNHLILCHPLLLLPSVFLSIRVFCNELALCNRWPKYWSFSISPSNEYLGLIPFRTDQFDLTAVQGTLKSLLQHHSSKASILQSSAFFMVQLSFLYMSYLRFNGNSYFCQILNRCLVYSWPCALLAK